jgi:2'-5' RNA ligase
MRLFVSVDLPSSLSEPVAAIQDDLAEASGLNFTDPDQAHLTLKFLGDTDPDELDPLTTAIETAVEEAGVEPFEATFGGLGVFPSPDYIRVVWLGVESGGEGFAALFEALEKRTVELGFDAESHDFTPHVTLARMEHAGGKELVQAALEEGYSVGSMTVDEVRLKESHFQSGGPVYETVERFPL